MTDDIGYITLDRKIIHWEWYDHLPTKCLFIHCLLRANYQDKNWRGYNLKRGQFLTSISSLVRETGLTTKQIRVALKNLEKTNEVAKLSSAKNTIITITNYEQYQDKGKQKDKEGASKGQSKGKVRAIDKETKETKETKYMEIWNDAFASTKVPKIRSIDTTRENKLHLRFQNIEEFIECISIIKKSPHLMGENERGWKVNFDWILEPKNLNKILEGNYVKDQKNGMGEWKTVR